MDRPDGSCGSPGRGRPDSRPKRFPHDFETDIKPLLEQNCLACHSSQTHQSGLVVETETALLKGGAIQGAAILAGNSQESPLIQRLRGTRAPRMPMNGQPLAEEQIQRIARWIDQLDPARAAEIAEHAKTPGWPWTPVTQPQVPAVKHKEWVRNPIDAFVLAKLEERRLDPAPAVSPRGLLRRLYYSLIGLPPTPEAMRRFLADPSPETYRLEVEKLLADSRYGEHWGRHWLDLARYSDTRGGAIDDPQTHLWRYRDYVIRAFNQDRPYDRFIKEQLAGDVFRAYGDEGKLGLGFLGLWVKVEANGQQGRRNYITDVVNTTGSVFMGLTLGCAQCHDHKYDPLPQQDYFRIEAFFSPVNFQKQDLAFHQYEMPLQDPERWETRKKAWKEHLEKIKKNAEAFSKELSQREIEHQLLVAPQDLKDWAHGDQKKIPFPKDTLRSAEEKERSRKISLMTGRFANPNVDGYYDPKAYVVRDSPLQHNIATYVLTGGNWRLRADQVKPGFLSAVTGNSDPVNMDGLVGSRRQLLAKWIARREHPLTARVMVNRIWQYHFGNGLVATPSDFGSNGSGTAHQDLIDWLAWEFMESGWSVKEIHRLIPELERLWPVDGPSPVRRIREGGSQQPLPLGPRPGPHPSGVVAGHHPGGQRTTQSVHGWTSLLSRGKPGADGPGRNLVDTLQPGGGQPAHRLHDPEPLLSDSVDQGLRRTQPGRELCRPGEYHGDAPGVLAVQRQIPPPAEPGHGGAHPGRGGTGPAQAGGQGLSTGFPAGSVT